MPKKKLKKNTGATLDPDTIKEVHRLRKEAGERRSFSAMADILMMWAIPKYRKEKGLPA